MGGKSLTEERLSTLRHRIHTLIAIAMTLIIICFELFSSSGVIKLIFTVAGYTYGPILGLFAFGLCTRRLPLRYAPPIVAVVVPVVCYIVSAHSEAWLGGYTFSYEIIVFNAALCFISLLLFSKRK